MNLEETLNKMQGIQAEYRQIFCNNPKLDQNGFIPCGLFGNLLKEHDIMFLGLNPGGSQKETNIEECHSKEIDTFRHNPCYNEFLEHNYNLIQSIKKLYQISFGLDFYPVNLQRTFYWNLCPLRGNSERQIGYEAYFELFKVVLKEVKPKIILTFIEVKKYLESKLQLNFNWKLLNELQSNSYYYLSDYCNIDGYTVKKIVAIPHLSHPEKYYNENWSWEKFGMRFKLDYDDAILNA